MFVEDCVAESKLEERISEAGDIFISGGKKADETGRPCLPVTNRWKVFHKTEQRQTEETDKQTASANKGNLGLRISQILRKCSSSSFS